MSGRLWQRWEEDALLQARPGELPALAERLGRSVCSVRSKHSRFCPSHKEVYWTNHEVKAVRRLWRKGMLLSDIARALGRPTTQRGRSCAPLGWRSAGNACRGRTRKSRPYSTPART